MITVLKLPVSQAQYSNSAVLSDQQGQTSTAANSRLGPLEAAWSLIYFTDPKMYTPFITTS